MMEDRANILREMKVCRFCLSSEQRELTNIYQKHTADTKQSVPLPLQIMACIAIEVFANDGMPQLICNSCRNHTLQAYAFKTNCKKADDALKVFLATGQLSKPYLQKVEGIKVNMQLQKPFKILNTECPKESSKTKHIKMEDGTEIITLNFTPSGEQPIEHSVHPGQNENESILGLEEEEGMVAEDDEDFTLPEMESEVSPLQKVNQVQTHCFPCPTCERSFPLKQLLDLHVPSHNRARNFECSQCNRKFFTKYDLQKHSLTHNGQKPHNCVICNKWFSRESLLRRHEKIHNDVPKYMCNYCDKTFLTKHYLDTHMANHKKKRPFTCHVCNKSFVFKQGLERHVIVHNNNNKPHKCNYCEASFTTAIKLTRHITSHAGLRPYPCKLCGRTFLLSHHLSRHMRSHYAANSSSPGVIGQHKCDICSMAFRRKDSLINHSAIHSMVNLRCVICNTSFETAKMVKEHITTHLTGLPFPCEKCDYSFDSSEQLEEHELKHAEMEYEEQIEQEVISEARQQQDDEIDEEEEYEEGEVTEYTITDISNPEVVPTSKSKQQEQHYDQFLKDELESDIEESETVPTESEQAHHEQEEEEQPPEEVEPIKPIIRQEGTKVYSRKATVAKKIPQIIQAPTNVAPLAQISQLDTQIDDLALSQQAINALPNKKFVNMKLGDKVVRVQKFIVTKEEMKAMAKQGILEMKGGQVVLKNPGQPVLNATLKPVQKVDIESLLDHKLVSRQQVKKYQRRPGVEKADNENLFQSQMTDTQHVERMDLGES